MTLKADVAAAIAADISDQAAAGYGALFYAFAESVPKELHPPDARYAFAELATDASQWKIIHRPGFRWPVVRSPFTAEKLPFVASVDMATFQTEGGEAMRFAVPDSVVKRLTEIAHDYRLFHAKAKGHA